MNISSIIDAARTILRLLEDYSRPPNREMLLDAMLYAYLEGCYGHMARQFQAPLPGKPAARVDYRRGTVAPVMIEFAVRSPGGGGQLYGSQNRAELCKLTRFSRTRARMRYLLLIDLSKWPIPQTQLKATYDKISSGPGRFKRHSVRVVYVSRTEQYHFSWNR
jgi:hypothetical protein